jgi:hypothetical protein
MDSMIKEHCGDRATHQFNATVALPVEGLEYAAKQLP